MKLLIFVLLFAAAAVAQSPQVAANGGKMVPRVVRIGDAEIAKVLKPNGRPLLVNFWATWCEPCREEFPDLVKIDADYKGKIDVVTISLDFIEDIETNVPKFLAEMKAEMPAYLLVSADESAIIGSIRKDWNGGLPFTVIYGADGQATYFKEGKFKTDILRAEIEKVVNR
jgi:thiol-disulfide isomerase/thioredoxin